MRRKLQEFNLGSRKQIGEYLVDFGWKPERFTPTGQPIVDEGTLKKDRTHPRSSAHCRVFIITKAYSSNLLMDR